jgi:hypothetical protein
MVARAVKAPERDVRDWEAVDAFAVEIADGLRAAGGDEGIPTAPPPEATRRVLVLRQLVRAPGQEGWCRWG